MTRMDPLPTPALVIDLPTVERNLQRMAVYAEEHDLDVRPHSKTHKSKQFGAAQIAAGAVGLTVAKAGEAEVMAAVADDLLVAYPTVGRDPAAGWPSSPGTARYAWRSIRSKRPRCWRPPPGASAATLGLLVDVDVGLGRTGVQTPAAALKLAQLIDRTAGVRLDGICCYPGHIWSAAGRPTGGAWRPSRPAGRDRRPVGRAWAGGPHRFPAARPQRPTNPT